MEVRSLTYMYSDVFLIYQRGIDSLFCFAALEAMKLLRRSQLYLVSLSSMYCNAH